MSYLWLKCIRLSPATFKPKCSQMFVRFATHYEILKLPRHCTSQEIKNAFVKLSKQFHPDVQGPTNNATEFVKINEAYQVLSKPHLRNIYDQDLLAREKMTVGSTNDEATKFYSPWEIRPDIDPSPGPYYGVTGINKMSNSRIVFFLIGLTIFGAIFGFVSAHSSYQSNRQKLDDRSAIAAEHYAAVRADAEKYTKEEQIARMIERMSKPAH